MDLDELLDASAPTVVPRTPELSEELRLLVAVSEAEARSSRRWHRVGAAAAVAVAVVGLGSAAAATGLLPGGLPWSTSAGTACEISFHVRMANGIDGEPRTFPEVLAMTEKERRAVLVAAEAFLADFDYDSIDRQAAIRRWQDVEPEEGQTKLVGDDLELTAVWFEVNNRLDEHLKSQGLKPVAILTSFINRCEQ